ncbi:MAG: glycosyltransferase family 4 protein [Candidatus Hydrogenedentota bacterium]
MSIHYPIRVLHLVDNPYLGGIPSHVLSVAEAFAADAHIRVDLAVLPGRTPDRTLVERAQGRGCAVHEIPMRGAFDPGVFRRLRRLTVAGKHDLVHTHGYRGLLIARYGRLPIPFVHTCHGGAVKPAFRTRIWERLSLRAMSKPRRIIACSEYVRRWLIAHGVASTKLEAVHNAVAEPAAPVQERKRQEFGIADEDTVFLYAGRLAPGKGLELLLEALDGLPNAFLLLAGEGPLRPRLETQAAESKAPVQFLGMVHDMAAFYELADVAVLPSEMEALPMGLIEAAAWGLPAVATHVGGIPEVVEDGVTGRLVPPGDAAALRAAMEEAISPAWRQSAAEAARARWEACFSPHRLREALARVYHEALLDYSSLNH